MKKITLFMAIAAIGLSACGEKSQPLAIDNTLTADEISAGILTPEVMWKMSRAGSSQLSPDGTQLVYTQTDYNMAENRGVTTIWMQTLADNAVVRLTDTSSNSVSPQWSADGQKIYFLSDRSGSQQVWEMTPKGEKATQLSSFDKDVEGFGVSPAGDKVWYVQRVQVADRLSGDIYKDMGKSNAHIYDDLMARHWNRWNDGTRLHIFVGDFGATGIAAGTDIIGADADWDAPMEPYFDMAEIAWNHAGTQLAYTCKPMAGAEYAVSTDSDIFLYDLAKGTSVNLLKPRADIDYHNAAYAPFALLGYDKYPVWSPDDQQLAFRSQKREGNESDKERLMVYDFKQALWTDLTAGFDNNAMNVVWADNRTLYFISPMQGTFQICRTRWNPDDALTAMKNGGAAKTDVEVITQGDHDINAFTMAGGKIVAEMTTISSDTEFYTVDPANGTLAQISAINKSIYDHIKMGEVQKRWVKTTDGKQMLTWVILPPNFDASKKYPTLLYCEGGPQTVVSQAWSYRWNFQLMAAQGYIVVAPNRRGCPSFGQEWTDQISGDYSGQNIRDLLSAIDDVAKEPWVDKDRLGCVGASYGGYSVYFLEGNSGDRFKAFIAHCGIFDETSMYGETEELWFENNDIGGPYWDKSNAVAQRSYAHSPHMYVNNWKAPILIFTGEFDFRIPYTQALEAFTAARLHGIPSRLVVFGDEAHQVFKPQNALVWNREFFGWLDKYVKNPAKK